MPLKKWLGDSNAPRWMTSNREGKCSECEDTIYEGDRIVWDPREFKSYCASCGEEVIDG